MRHIFVLHSRRVLYFLCVTFKGRFDANRTVMAAWKFCSIISRAQTGAGFLLRRAKKRLPLCEYFFSRLYSRLWRGANSLRRFSRVFFRHACISARIRAKIERIESPFERTNLGLFPSRDFPFINFAPRFRRCAEAEFPRNCSEARFIGPS